MVRSDHQEDLIPSLGLSACFMNVSVDLSQGGTWVR